LGGEDSGFGCEAAILVQLQESRALGPFADRDWDFECEGVEVRKIFCLTDCSPPWSLNALPSSVGPVVRRSFRRLGDSERLKIESSSVCSECFIMPKAHNPVFISVLIRGVQAGTTAFVSIRVGPVVPLGSARLRNIDNPLRRCLTTLNGHGFSETRI
jgi:hypothetical protein